ncbi:sulfite exporter TauE/SafE family protein [Comamonas resistens]|uniref:Probable membrane transporter protein n=1 Tax=Comamonas resistens TaxID=3046670 RepID=A0ABY8SN46_9BURK|nr:sulfite exporter TauE/SafE family protein [Comamonas resistens]MDL5039115.1 sulfite exporter TauE/SafE family protein [Comamonas resistens]WHS63785.1 sulfite exporter TauE/SafE family protein [Comamonas resistens]
MTGEQWLLASLAVLAASFVQGSSGMGFALIVAPVLTLLAPDLLPVCVLILMLPLNAYVAWRERHALDRRGASWISAGRMVGTFGGLAVLALLSAQALSIFVGLSTIAAAVVTWFIPAFTPGLLAFIMAGLITGVTETATGIGGPPMALTYQHRPPAEMRATMALCFLIGELISLVFLLFMGKVQMLHLSAALQLLPALAVGAVASRFVHTRIDAKVMRLFVQAFAVISGLVLLIKAW